MSDNSKLDIRKIPQFTSWGNYRIDVSWDYLEEQLERNREPSVNLSPDFQRSHVWTTEQQIAYVEFCLQGGRSGREILFNCVGWMGSFEGPYELVDGLQRLTAVRMFLRGELPVFGHLLHELTGTIRASDGKLRFFNQSFSWHVNDLKTRAEVLQWYLDINTGGTPHTEAELLRVRQLLHREKRK